MLGCCSHLSEVSDRQVKADRTRHCFQLNTILWLLQKLVPFLQAADRQGWGAFPGRCVRHTPAARRYNKRTAFPAANYGAELIRCCSYFLQVVTGR
jgi:hypothetical protein